jgi:hypothetical protein
MKTCPRCGYANPDTAALCEDCDRALSAPDSAVAPPSGMSGQPQEPVPMPRPSFWTPLRLYLLGIGLGLIPLAVWLVGWSASSCSYLYGGLYWPTSGLGGGLETAAVLLYLLQLVGGGGLLAMAAAASTSSSSDIARTQRTRHVGSGLLTMALVDPVVGAIGCSVIASRPR